VALTKPFRVDIDLDLMAARRNNPRSDAPDAGASRSVGDLERIARGEIEEHREQPIGDEEWAHQRARLLEFVQILSHWESEQRRKEDPDSGRAA
jgi:hypothetical protein